MHLSRLMVKFRPRSLRLLLQCLFQKCVKRGPLGACLETETRTAENDNDKSLKYFRDPSESMKKKDLEMRSSVAESEEGNLLIEKLRRQSEENREKNDLLVKQKTLMNDQVRSMDRVFAEVLCFQNAYHYFVL